MSQNGPACSRSPMQATSARKYVFAEARSADSMRRRYIGEDTSLIASLLPHVIYHSGVRVFHRRRAFPGPYLRQRWRYRVKTGEMLARGAPAYAKNFKIKAFLVVGAIAIVAAPITSFPTTSSRSSSARARRGCRCATGRCCRSRSRRITRRIFRESCGVGSAQSCVRIFA